MTTIFDDWLRLDPKAAQFFTTLTPSSQHRYLDWVAKAKTTTDQTDRLQHVVYELNHQHKTLKIGSYMGDVRPIKDLVDAPLKRQQLIELSELVTHHQMAICNCDVSACR